MHVKKNTIRDRSAILADIAKTGLTVEGTLTETQRKLKNGKTYQHFHLQRWEQGRNITAYVPKHKVRAVKEGIANREKLTGLFKELAAADSAAVFCASAPEDHLKKKRPK
jgi:hypothetical protein